MIDGTPLWVPGCTTSTKPPTESVVERKSVADHLNTIFGRTVSGHYKTFAPLEAAINDALAEIRRLEDAIARWKHEQETIWVPLDRKATRYREALERIVLGLATIKREHFTPELGAIEFIATEALEEDPE